MSTQHIIPADKKIYTATYQPLKPTCVELKSILMVLLAYPPLVTFGKKSLFLLVRLGNQEGGELVFRKFKTFTSN